MYRWDLALNNQQDLICYKTQPTIPLDTDKSDNEARPKHG